MFLVLIDENERLKEKLKGALYDLNIDGEDIITILRIHRESTKQIITFLRIELGIEAFFQIAGIFVMNFCFKIQSCH